MSEHGPITDGDLIAQLRRRSNGGRVESEQSTRDFVAGVGSKIDAGATAPVATQSWPALAGLAGAAAILFVLVVALPRLAPGGSSPRPTDEGPPSTVSTMPVRKFAARVGAGDLRGETVLVNAEIIAAALPGPGQTEPCPPPGPCLIGALATGVGISPAVYAYGLAMPDETSGWSWTLSYVPRPPFSGVMALAVDAEGRIIFVGRNPSEEIASALGEIAFVDFDTMPLDEIRVVPAWLAGTDAAFPCPTMGPEWRDLLGRHCGDSSWLTPERVKMDPFPLSRPSGAMQVQSGAYRQFAETPVIKDGSAEPRAGLYLIAKRLEGSGCPNDRPPCWQWEIIGRLTINGDSTLARPFATPAPQTLTPLASAGSVTRSFPCLGDSISVTFDDTTGLVTGCSVVEVDRHNPNGATNPTGNLSTLQVLWGSSRCITTAFIEFKGAGDGYIAQVTESGADCETAPDGYLPEAYAVVLNLSAPLLGETVSVSVVRDSEPGGSSPQPISPIDCPTAVRVPMAEQPTWRVLMHDETGLIESCTRATTSARVGDPPIVVSNTDGTALRLLVEWEESPCVDKTPFRFRRLGDGYELIVERLSVVCAMPVERRAMYFDLKQPLLASSIAASVSVIEPGPSEARRLECSIDPESPEADLAPITSVLDQAGLITNCAAFAGTPEFMAIGWSDVIVRNSAANQLQVIWATTFCDRHSQIDISRPHADAFLFEVHLTDDYAECESRAAQYLVLDLAEPVLAASVSTTLVRASDVPDPNPPPSPFPQFLECSSAVSMFRDATGLVESCGSWVPDPGLSGVFEGADLSSVRVAWTYSDCHGAPYVKFEEIAGQYVFGLGFIVNLPSVLPSCQPVVRTVGIEVHFTRPIDIALISAPERSPRSTIDVAPLRQQAEQALARWADAISESGRPDIIFLEGITNQSGNWEDDVGSNNKSALYAGLIEAGVPLATETPPPGEVRWPDGSSTTVDLLTAGDALQQLTAHATSTCDRCQPLQVTDARLASADFETTRGMARVPVWKYTIAGSDVQVIQVAVANGISLLPPPWDSHNTPKGASIGSARGALDSRELFVTTEGEPPTDAETCTDFTAEAMESDLAVVVFITAFHPDQSSDPGDELDDVSCGVVTLSSPLGDRAVLEVTEGMPVLLLPPE